MINANEVLSDEDMMELYKLAPSSLKTVITTIVLGFTDKRNIVLGLSDPDQSNYGLVLASPNLLSLALYPVLYACSSDESGYMSGEVCRAFVFWIANHPESDTIINLCDSLFDGIRRYKDKGDDSEGYTKH